ncbi:MAG: hypothetical protein WKG01_19255 [Kofleriaceae bacterium]
MSVRGSVTALALCACFAIGLPWTHAQGTPSESPAIARAQGHIAAVEYELAQAALEEALRAGGNQPDVTAAIHGLLGVIAASRDRPAEAQAAFARQLAIDPAADVDRELGPRSSSRSPRRGPLSVRAQS